MEKRARLCLEDGLVFHTELSLACANGFNIQGDVISLYTVQYVTREDLFNPTLK